MTVLLIAVTALQSYLPYLKLQHPSHLPNLHPNLHLLLRHQSLHLQHHPQLKELMEKNV